MVDLMVDQDVARWLSAGINAINMLLYVFLFQLLFRSAPILVRIIFLPMLICFVCDLFIAIDGIQLIYLNTLIGDFGMLAILSWVTAFHPHFLKCFDCMGSNS